MSIFDHDPEVPAGYQDADLEQAQWEEAGRRQAALRRQGVCTHGWVTGGGPLVWPVQREGVIGEGEAFCHHCGYIVTDIGGDVIRDALTEAQRGVLDFYVARYCAGLPSFVEYAPLGQPIGHVFIEVDPEGAAFLVSPEGDTSEWSNHGE